MKTDSSDRSGHRHSRRQLWRAATKAALIYFCAALLWFGALEQLTGGSQATSGQLALRGLLGFGFVVLSALTISLIVRREMARELETRAALQESESRKAAILDSALDAIVTIDHEGKILEVNAATQEIFGFDREEMIGRDMAELIMPARHRESHRQGLRRIASARVGRMVGRRLEISAVRKGGEEFPVELAISLIAREGPPIFTGTIRDITERKRAERDLADAQAKLRQHADALEIAVAERTASLREMVMDLEAFSYSLSHDMRAPLRSMRGFSELLLHDFGAKLGSEGQEYLQRIASASTRLDRLIQDMLSYSRLTHGILSLELIDPERLVREIIQERPNLQRFAASIHLITPLLPIYGHEAALTQCLSNLLENAVKFVAPEVQPEVRIWTDSVDTDVRLWIQDNGIGIPKEAFDKVFGMFQRLHHHDSYSGTGIGLTIVRKAVERMGGRVLIESEVGKGSRFCLQLKGKPPLPAVATLSK
jgi:PAS domain S-box-containing protein